MRLWASIAVVGLSLVVPAAIGESIFDFEALTPGTSVPFSYSVNGLTATFSGTGSVCASTGLSGNLFVGLAGNALMQGFCKPDKAGPLTVTFSSNLTQLSFAVAVNGTTPVPVTVNFLEDGRSVGTQTLKPVVFQGGLGPETTVTYTGAFNSVVITSTGLLALDNLDAVPTN